MDDQSPAVAFTGRVMIVAIVILLIVVAFVLFLHLYAKWFWWRIESNTVPSREARQIRHRRRRLNFAQTQDPIRKGLDPSTLKSLPILDFNSEDFKDGLECAVCLSEITHGEKTRLLPKCNHGFHLKCIDMWFESDSSCPLCRNIVCVELSDLNSPESGVPETFPANVLFWGNESEMNSGGSSSSPASGDGEERVLVIDIPAEVVEEEVKSPLTSRLRSLKRLLSKEKWVGPSGSNCGVDDEQGQ